eukprot:2685209-Pleurochrysis_carterae.AAC.1
MNDPAKTLSGGQAQGRRLQAHERALVLAKFRRLAFNTGFGDQRYSCPVSADGQIKSIGTCQCALAAYCAATSVCQSDET